jgi:ABC-type Fe3+/spermidine/putrescine transport system ATPase subunit
MSNSGFGFHEVSKTYAGKPALDRVSMQIPSGPHIAILGPSGCGKSTMLRLLAGLEEPTEGSIQLDGQTISAAGRVIQPPHLRGVAMLFQDLALWPNLSTRANVGLGLTGLRLARQESSRRIGEALELCGIADLADRYPSQLSGGQQQRAALARAIAVRPRFLLLDEPFSGIDLATKARLLKQIGDMACERQFQIILVSHDPWETLELCETAIILDQGSVQGTGRVVELLETGDGEPCLSFRQLRERLAQPIGNPARSTKPTRSQDE